MAWTAAWCEYGLAACVAGPASCAAAVVRGGVDEATSDAGGHCGRGGGVGFGAAGRCRPGGGGRAVGRGGRLGHGDRGAGHGRPEHGRGRRHSVRVVRGGGRLRRGRAVQGIAPPLPGVRGDRGRGPVAQGDRGARHRRREHGRGRRHRVGVVPGGGQLRRGRVLHRRLRPRAGVRGDRGGWPVAEGDRGAGHGRAEHGRVRGHRVGVVRGGGQLRRGRVLRRRLRPRAGVRGDRGGWPVAHGDRGAGHGRPEQGGRRSPFGVVRGGGQLRRGRVLPRRLPPPSGVRGDGGGGPVAHGDRGAGHGRPEHGRVRRRLFGVVRGGGQLRRRRVLQQPPRSLAGVRGDRGGG